MTQGQSILYKQPADNQCKYTRSILIIAQWNKLWYLQMLSTKFLHNFPKSPNPCLSHEASLSVANSQGIWDQQSYGEIFRYCGHTKAWQCYFLVMSSNVNGGKIYWVQSDFTTCSCVYLLTKIYDPMQSLQLNLCRAATRLLNYR